MSDKKYLNYFPVRQNNHFELLVNGEQFYPAIISAINNAQTEVIIENYLTISGKILTEFITALRLAAKRNVKIYCLFDGYGSKGITNTDLSLLSVPNIELQFYNKLKYHKYLKNLFRDHRKIFIIDRQQAFIGGAGISDQFDSTKQHSWHDIMLSIKGDVIQDWLLLFNKNWQCLTQTAFQQPIIENTTISTNPHFTTQGKVLAFTAPHQQEIKRHILHEIHKSKKTIFLTTPYFVLSRKLRRALIRAAQRGVNVKLLLPGSITDHPGVRIIGQRHYAQLLRHNVKIFEYALHFSHAKVLLCDHWCTTGSSNFDRWNFRWNLESNQAIFDNKFSKTLQHWFEQELKQCNEIRYEQWRNRTLWQRLKEWFWGVIVQLLDKLKRPK